ncbi:MAG: hypothetical protein ABI282_05135 [Candidatus Baltobacteraceae bacterium]
MAEETRIYENIERSKVDTLRSALAAFVSLPDGDHGEIAKGGFAGTFDYDEPAKRLTLTIAESPPLVPRAMVWSTIERSIG